MANRGCDAKLRAQKFRNCLHVLATRCGWNVTREKASVFLAFTSFTVSTAIDVGRLVMVCPKTENMPNKNKDAKKLPPLQKSPGTFIVSPWLREAIPVENSSVNPA
jgi:hypothetical protein